MSEVKEMMPQLEETVKQYQLAKDEFFSRIRDTPQAALKKEMNFDKNITHRMHQIIKSYDSLATYN